MNRRQRNKAEVRYQERKIAGLIYDDFLRLDRPETTPELAEEILSCLHWHAVYGTRYVRRMLVCHKDVLKMTRKGLKLAFR